MDSYQYRCLEYFCQNYGRRVKDENLGTYPLPKDLQGDPKLALLPYLLNDNTFYLGRVYALTAFNPLAETKNQDGPAFHLGRILWELNGMQPDELIVQSDSLNHKLSSFPTEYPRQLESWLESHTNRSSEVKRQQKNNDSLRNFDTFMQHWPPDSGGSFFTILRMFFKSRLTTVLRENHLGMYITSLFVPSITD